MPPRSVLLLPLTALLCVPLLATPASAQQGPSERRYIVEFASGTAPDDGALQVRAGGGQVENVLRHVFSGTVARLSEQGAAALSRNPRVARVEADQAVRASGTQANPPWGLDRVDQRSRSLSSTFSWTATGEGVTTYVLDTGVRRDHADFEGRVVAGHTVIKDGRGTEDCNGHGTHVAGTVGGRTHGVAKSVRLVPVRVLDCEGGGTVSGIVSALDWVAAQGARPAVATLSLGGPPSGTLDTAVQSAVDKGISVVVAAGNEGADACSFSPARVPAALTVGATDTSDARLPYSNYGRCLDLFAPGHGISSAWHTTSTATALSSGTSMSVPHVAGTVAALLQAEPSLTPAKVADRLRLEATTDVVTGTSGSPNRLLWADPQRGTVTPAGTVSGPFTASSAAPGAADLLARGAVGDAVVVPWTESGGTGTPTSIGGRVIGAPAAGVRSTGRLEVVVRGTDDRLWTKPRTPLGTWGAWSSLGGVLTSRPATAVVGERLDVVVRGGDGALWQRFSTSAGSWSRWYSLGGRILPGTAPAAAWASSSRLVVTVVGTDRRVYVRTWVRGAGWSRWQSLGGATDHDVTAAPIGDDQVLVAVRGTNGVAYSRVVRPLSTTSWARLGGELAGPPAATSAPGSGQAQLFALALDARLLSGTWSNGWSGWSNG